jgi:alpha-ribazole phosphatase
LARRLLLVRHGAIGDSYPPLYVGSTDLPLTKEGRQEAEALARMLPGREPIRCLSSPLRRAAQTADAIASAAGLQVEIDPDLREIDFGRWEGKTFEEINASDPEEVDCWVTSPGRFSFPEGESVKDFLNRVRRATDRITADPADVVLAVTHGGVIRAMICYLLGLAPEKYVLFSVETGSVSTVELFEKRGVLTELNNTSHLEEA